MASIWGGDSPSVPWGVNTWQSNTVTVSLTGLSITSELGDESAFNVEGWGRQQWNNSGWGVEYSVEPSGQSITSSQGTAEGSAQTIASLSGLSINVDATYPTVDLVTPISPTGLSITSSLGTANAENLAGWGRQAWGNSGWGIHYSVELSGQSITSSLGTATGTAIETVEVSGQSMTSSVGDISPADVVGISTAGVITSTLGDLASVGTLVGWGRNGWGEESWGESVNKVIQPTGLSVTASVGSTTVADMVVGLTGQSFTASVGAISPADVMGLTGQEFEASVGSLTDIIVGLDSFSITSSVGAVDIFAYGDVDTGSNTSYSNVSTGSNTNYSSVATGSNTSYSDAA